jgi:hypothetical protein
MKVVTDKTIDGIIEILDANEENFEKALDKAADDQPLIFSYLTSESFDLLTEEEKGYMVYIGLILYLSYKKTNPNLQVVSEDMIGEAEEANYELLEGATGLTLGDKLDVFFEEYEQEELLLLAEEAVMEDEEDEEESVVTDEGAETIFVALKSIIDAMIAATPA